MAVQQNKKSVSRRGNRRSHDFLTNPPTAIEPSTGEAHRRHHISPNGFYRGKKVVFDQERRLSDAGVRRPSRVRAGGN
jgi:large subunit ribosomal protein L32